MNNIQLKFIAQKLEANASRYKNSYSNLYSITAKDWGWGPGDHYAYTSIDGKFIWRNELMSSEYNRYLSRHIENVEKGYKWLKEHFVDVKIKMTGYDYLFLAHDGSKYYDDEYDAYDNYFYGNRSYENVKNFKYAWLHHIHNNPHHWQYWVLQNDDEGEEILEMPYHYIIEMICDWWSFSWLNDNLYEIFDWYEKHKSIMKLGEKTRKTVEDILSKIKTELDKDTNVENAEDSLAHHGIKGQKWGVKNGPPYPINSELKNKTPAKVETINNYSGKLYWLSEDDLDGKTLEPRVPDNFFVKNGFEDAHTKRLCFAPTIDQCLMAISQNLTDKKFNIYEPSEPITTVQKPNIGAVPDSDITGELWVTDPVKLKKTGRIHVTGDDGKDGLKFEYGNNVAELYGWNYKNID